LPDELKDTEEADQLPRLLYGRSSEIGHLLTEAHIDPEIWELWRANPDANPDVEIFPSLDQ
jgi:hypothetical protein